MTRLCNDPTDFADEMIEGFVAANRAELANERTRSFGVAFSGCTLLEGAGLEIVDLEVGELVTSFDMAGASLTLLWLDDEIERFWRASAAATADLLPRIGRARPHAEKSLGTPDAGAHSFALVAQAIAGVLQECTGAEQ